MTMTETFAEMLAGGRFKVVNCATGELERGFHSEGDALACAKRAHQVSPQGHHFKVVEIKFCGGSLGK
jgi:hypothetical protein